MMDVATLNPSFMLDYTSLMPLSGNPAKQVVVILPGYVFSVAASMATLTDVAVSLQSTVPDCEFICVEPPHAMNELDLVKFCNPANHHRKWFNLNLSSPDDILEGVQATEPLLNDLIDHILSSLNIKPEELAIIGISPGAIMALHTAPRRPTPIACIITYCGLLIDGATLSQECKSDPPVLMIHGAEDDVVPFVEMAKAKICLTGADIETSTLAVPNHNHNCFEPSGSSALA